MDNIKVRDLILEESIDLREFIAELRANPVSQNPLEAIAERSIKQESYDLNYKYTKELRQMAKPIADEISSAIRAEVLNMDGFATLLESPKQIKPHEAESLDTYAEQNLYALFDILDRMFAIRLDEETNRQGKDFAYEVNKNLAARRNILGLEAINFETLLEVFRTLQREPTEYIKSFLYKLSGFVKLHWDHGAKIIDNLEQALAK